VGFVSSPELVSKIISECYTLSVASLSNVDSLAKDISLKDIPECPIGITEVCTINWKADLAVPVKSVLAEKKVEFRGDKTYWMIGMTGDLGLSITQWMVERGAKHIVLTSRNPRIDQGWLDTMAAAGANVQAWPM